MLTVQIAEKTFQGRQPIEYLRGLAYNIKYNVV